MLPSTYTPVELLWTLLGAGGLIAAGFNIHDTYLDHRAIKMHEGLEHKKALLIVARAGVRQEILRAIKLAVVFFVGLLAGLTKPPLPPGVHLPYWTPTTIIITGALFIIVGIILLQMELDRRLRRRFYSRQNLT